MNESYLRITRSRSWRAKTLASSCAGLFGLILIARSSNAAVKTWDNGAGNATWTSANNWNLNTLPANGDDLVFPSGGVTIPINQTIGAFATTWNIEAFTEGGANNVTLYGPSATIVFNNNGTGFFTPGIRLESSFGSGASQFGTVLITSGPNITLQANATFYVAARASPNGFLNVLCLVENLSATFGG